MATEQDWAAYADQAFMATTDTLLARTAAGAGVEIAGDHLLARRTGGGRFSGAGGLDLLSAGANFSIVPDAASGANGVLLEASFSAGGYGPMRFGAGGGEAARITPSREFLIGTTSSAGLYNGSSNRPGTNFDPGGTISVQRSNGANMWLSKAAGYTDGYLAVFAVNGIGVGSITTTGTATAYNTSSDYRLKEDLQAVENPLARLLAVPVWNFAWKATGARTDGFMAHELAEVVPCAVTGDKDAMQEVDVEIEPERTSDVLGPDGAPVIIPALTEKRLVPAYQGIDQAKVVPLLIAAVQELAGIVDALTARVAELEAVR